MSEANDVFEIVKRKIAEARYTHPDTLRFGSPDFHALDGLPHEIGLLDNLRELSLHQTKVADIASLRGLENLRTLNLNQTPINDIYPLQGLANLQILNLHQTKVADIAPLQGLTNLRTLSLSRTRVADISSLRALANLQVLNLQQTQVADITALQGLTNLKELHLDQTQITDISPLQRLTNLETLTIGGTKVTEITRLQHLSNLQRLNLGETHVADIDPLQGLDQLRSLDVRHTLIVDLRPIAGLPKLGNGASGGLWFTDTPAALFTPDLALLSGIEDNRERTRATQTYLKTLPPWPEPLPQEHIAADAIRPDNITRKTFDMDGTTNPALPLGNPPNTLPRRITAKRAREVLETRSSDLREQCQFVTEQINDTLAHQIPAKPNDPEQLAAWTHLVNTLELSRSAITSLHAALPEQTDDRPVTEAEANHLKKAFGIAIAKLQEASAYIDGPAEAHGRTYAGLLKIGVCTALAAPLAIVSAQPVALIGAGLYAMLYGKGQAMDVIKAIGASSGSRPDQSA